MRQCVCKDCGKIYLTDKNESWYCPECAKEHAKDVLIDRVCSRCGAKFVGYPNSKYCPACLPEVIRERNREQRRSGPARPIGSIDLCQKCGKEYIVKSGLQKYCSDCAAEAIREKARARKRQYNRDNREYFNSLRRCVKDGRKVCIVCGNPFNSDTPTVTCSPECAAEHKRLQQAKADYKRGRRKSIVFPPKSNNPKSGIAGISWHKKTGKWQLVFNKRYIGLFDTVEAAAARRNDLIAEFEKSNLK